MAWRDFWAFGSAHLGDFGCHDLDAACWALDLKEPLSVEAHPAGGMNSEPAEGAVPSPQLIVAVKLAAVLVLS